MTIPLSDIQTFIAGARWFGGKGREWAGVREEGFLLDQAHPVLSRLFAHLTRGLMPIEVQGDVQRLVNKTADGWLVTLINPAGQAKPQQGITPTDYRQNRNVTIKAKVAFKSAFDRLLPDDPLKVEGNSVTLEVPAGGVRVVELK